MLRFIYLINLYHTSFFSIHCIKYVWHTKSLMQKWFGSQTFTVCRTLLLWELFLHRWREKTLLCHQIFSRLASMGVAYLRWFAVILPTVVAWSVWTAFENFTIKPGYMLFISGFCVHMQSKNNLVHKKQLQSTVFSLHMFKFATI